MRFRPFSVAIILLALMPVVAHAVSEPTDTLSGLKISHALMCDLIATKSCGACTEENLPASACVVTCGWAPMVSIDITIRLACCPANVQFATDRDKVGLSDRPEPPPPKRHVLS